MDEVSACMSVCGGIGGRVSERRRAVVVLFG